ncbi:MerR family transcriptional regulator [Jiangella alkaliphila]|uniref:Helix-turn-helix domain-containing protein n=1 Tax=Jiangella alkaliphila TaxID=419479 RepID=A0A1H2IDR1_9ACTN|nr:hypothetical protein [Jiangella alkaliphila]SDU42145.1 hypothetical protein SAMN04488563_1629 [Jiangella alkaliphila]
MGSDDLITSTQAAEILGVDRATVSRWSDDRLKPEARKLHVAKQLPGQSGARLFDVNDVHALRARLDAEKAAAAAAKAAGR